MYCRDCALWGAPLVRYDVARPPLPAAAPWPTAGRSALGVGRATRRDAGRHPSACHISIFLYALSPHPLLRVLRAN